MNAPVAPPAAMTRAEFERRARAGDFGGRRLELRRGKLVEVSPQYAPHMRLKLKLITMLAASPVLGPLGWEVGSEGTIDFADDFQPMPDIFIWDPALAPLDLDGPIPAGAVNLVIEVSSSTLSDDLGEKRADYAAAGVAEYWVVDVARRIVHRHAAPGAGGFTRVDQIALADGVDSWTIAGLTISA
jgi:Uma2 family endonuclease